MHSSSHFRVAVLINANAGASTREKVHARRDAMTSALLKHGMAADLQFLASAELRSQAQLALERATKQEINAVVVGGGDGSIRTVAEVFAGTGIPIGIIPLGTMNHFARDIGIPLSIDAAVNLISSGHTRHIDVADVNGRIFINNSSIGIYPYMVLDREHRRSADGWPKWIATLLAVFRTLRHFPLRRLSICIESETEPYRTPCVFVGNNEYGLNATALGRRETLDKGLLWLYVAKQRNRVSLIWLACRAFLGLLDEGRDLRILTTRSAEIRSRTSRLVVAMDGEVEMMRPPLRYRTRPGSLRVFAP